MLKDIALDILSYSWPMLVIALTILISIRITYFIKNKKRPVIYEELTTLIFIIYFLCLFYAVTYQDVEWSTANYIPFKEIFRYPIGSNLFFKNIFGNIILFMPYGYLIGKYTKVDKQLSVIFLAFVGSLSIEITQLLIGRVFDVDDIMLNIIGAILGYLIYKFFLTLSNRFKILKNEIVLNILGILLLGGLIWFLIP